MAACAAAFSAAAFSAAGKGRHFLGEGCGAIVLKRLQSVAPASTVYATVDGVGCAASAAQSARTALEEATLSASEVELLELTRAASPDRTFHIAVTPLGAAFAQCQGFASIGDDGDSDAVTVTTMAMSPQAQCQSRMLPRSLLRACSPCPTTHRQ